jgi:sec-independent protein translocase protein TatA
MERIYVMLGGHLPELIVILLLALVVFGPKRLPEIAGSLGKGIRDFRQSVSGESEQIGSPQRHIADPVASKASQPEDGKVIG